MRALVTYFIKYPIASNLLMFAIVVIGMLSAAQLKFTFFPEVEVRVVSVTAAYPGAAPSEIEEGIVAKVEEEVKGLTGVKKIQSVSSENFGSITVILERGTDVDKLTQDVKNAVDQINSFPDGMEPPVVKKLEFFGQGLTLGLTGDVSLRKLKEYAREIEEDLKANDGLSKVDLLGFPEEEIEIAFREDDLRTFQLTFAEAAAAIRGSNLELTGGRLQAAEEEFIIRSKNKSYFANDLKDIVIKSYPNGSVIRLYQVADVTDQWEDAPDRIYLDGQPAVVLDVQNTRSEDILDIAVIVKEYVERFNKTYSDVELIVVEDNSKVIQGRTELLTWNGIVGFVIVMVLLAMFLHWRVAFWVAIAIPISFCGMFIMAVTFGITLNVITLFGMILVIGILVDDGIVIGENIYQLYEKGYTRTEAAIEGTMEVLPAVFSAILTTVIAFMTFFFIDGTLGDFFTEMAIVVIFALVFSLVEGALILPAHLAHSKALTKKAKINKVQVTFEKLMDWLKIKIYAPILRFAMSNKLIVIAVSITTFFLSIGAVGGGIVKTTFFPNIPGESFQVNVKMPSGTRESVVLDILDRIESEANALNADLSDKYFAGDTLPIFKVRKTLGPTINEGNVGIVLIDAEIRDTITDLFISGLLRNKVGPVYGAEYVTYGGNTPFGKPFNLSFLGNNYDELVGAVAEVEAKMRALPDLKDVLNNNQEGVREIDIQLNQRGEFLGLNLQQVISQVRNGFFGAEVQRLQRGRDEVKVWVRYTEDDRSDLSKLKDIRIRTNTGSSVPLREIADFNIERGVININRLDGQKEIRVEADIANSKVSTSEVTTLLEEEIVPEVLKNYPTVAVDFGGQNEDQADTMNSGATTLPFILLLMFIVIAMTFRSVGQTIAVLALIPFGFIGVVMGHFFLDIPISLFSNLGMIALIGIIVNDALVMVSKYNSLISDGMQVEDAIYEAGVSRFRPIVLTSVTTFAGLAPLLFEKSVQAQFLIPMAVSIAFGLLVVTFIILVLLPILLLLVNRLKVYSIYAWEGKKPQLEIVEPGYTGVLKTSYATYESMKSNVDIEGNQEIEIIEEMPDGLLIKDPSFEGRVSRFGLWFISGLLALGLIGGVLYAFITLAGKLVG